MWAEDPQTQARFWGVISPNRESPGELGALPSWLWPVPGPCSGIQGSPVRVAEFRAGSVLPFECSPAANGPCAPPGGFCEGCQQIAARAAFGRRFESRQLQFHNTAFSKASGSLIGVQPKIKQLVSDEGPRPDCKSVCE